ncbi:hypothetical protein D3C86_1568110 [compost metagenome]
MVNRPSSARVKMPFRPTTTPCIPRCTRALTFAPPATTSPIPSVAWRSSAPMTNGWKAPTASTMKPVRTAICRASPARPRAWGRIVSGSLRIGSAGPTPRCSAISVNTRPRNVRVTCSRVRRKYIFSQCRPLSCRGNTPRSRSRWPMSAPGTSCRQVFRRDGRSGSTSRCWMRQAAKSIAWVRSRTARPRRARAISRCTWATSTAMSWTSKSGMPRKFSRTTAFCPRVTSSVNSLSWYRPMPSDR